MSLWAFATYIYQIFPKDTSKDIVKIMQIVAILFSCIVIVAHSYFHTQLLIVFQLITLLSGLYFTWVLIRATYYRRKRATYFLVFWVLFFLTVVNDIAYSYMMVNTGYISHIGLFLFVFAQNALLTSRFSRAFEKSKTLNHQLNTIHTGLESLVKEKTDKLSNAYFELHKSFGEIRFQTDNITQGIEYAKKIQYALLPDLKIMEESLQNIFIFYQPKDIVSGDFYWFGLCQNKIIVSAIDCTGHGVPGALMSIMANDILNDLIYNQQILNPAYILTEMDRRVKITLKQEYSNNKDGMEMSIVVIDQEKKEMYFSGAKSPIYIIQKKQLLIIPGDKKSVGGQMSRDIEFNTHTISIQKPTTFYLCSDGYQDQFGGEKGRKFLMGPFRELLFNIHQVPLDVQKELITKTLENWMNPKPFYSNLNNKVEKIRRRYDQTDDILIIGIRLNEEF